EGDAFIEESPLSYFADRKHLRQGYYALCDNKQISSALIVIRLEGFEQVNQHFGRDFGYILLAQSANRIKELLSSD
ncbi:diguanylate cyclase, partial [Pseudoalteromonas issachenkonii]